MSEAVSEEKTSSKHLESNANESSEEINNENPSKLINETSPKPITEDIIENPIDDIAVNPVINSPVEDKAKISNNTDTTIIVEPTAAKQITKEILQSKEENECAKSENVENEKEEGVAEVSKASTTNLSIDSTIGNDVETIKNTEAATGDKETVTNDDTTVAESTQASKEYEEHITYTENGNAIYTDPKTNHKYKWCTEKNNWTYWKSSDNEDNATSGTDNPFENEHYKWCSKLNQWILKSQETQNETTTCTQTETEHYKWDAALHAWIPKVKQQETQQAAAEATVAGDVKPDLTYGLDEDGQRIYTDKDGAVFFWDAHKSAWFPKIDDEFMARYQMNYGFIDNTSASEQERQLKEETEKKRKAAELQAMAEEARKATAAMAAGEGVAAGDIVGGKRKAAQEPPTWFELNPDQNTKVYISNLPLDVTLDEFAEIMSKCGMIMRDPQTQKYKLKLYTAEDGQIKGDGLCDYIKVESVDLALKILDESEVRGHKIHVQRAKFQMRGEYNPALKPKRKKKDKEKLQKMKEKLFDWRPEKMRGERSKNEKTVILKNLFQPELFEKEVELILEYQNDLREECGKCGTVRKVVIYDLHPEGVGQVNMSSPEEADLVIQMMQGRYFGKRQLTAEHWDGKTKYKIAETDIAAKSRKSQWDEFLETDGEKKEVPVLKAATATTNKTADAVAESTAEEVTVMETATIESAAQELVDH